MRRNKADVEEDDEIEAVSRAPNSDPKMIISSLR